MFLLSVDVAISAFVIVALVGCDGTPDNPEAVHLTFTGLVTSVDSRSLLELESIVVADQSGRVLQFHANGNRFEAFTPSHVREHMLIGDPLVVTYTRSGDRLLIVSLEDAFAGPPEPSG